jgi:hypothetical protein
MVIAVPAVAMMPMPAVTAVAVVPVTPVISIMAVMMMNRSWMVAAVGPMAMVTDVAAVIVAALRHRCDGDERRKCKKKLDGAHGGVCSCV